MPAVTINGQRIDVPAGGSLFDGAEQAGVRVPTSCSTQGKCKECIVEVDERHGTARAADRRTSGTSRARSACRVSAGSSPSAGDDRVPHDAPRPHAHRAPRRSNLPVSRTPMRARSGGHARRRSHPRSMASNRRESSGPIHGLAMDLGTTTVVRAPDQPRDRRARGRRLVREPAAVRRLRRDVAHSLRHRAPGQAPAGERWPAT